LLFSIEYRGGKERKKRENKIIKTVLFVRNNLFIYYFIL